MKIIVFAVLSVVAVGYAQPPPRPVIPETFQSKVRKYSYSYLYESRASYSWLDNATVFMCWFVLQVDVMYYEWETTYGNGMT